MSIKEKRHFVNGHNVGNDHKDKKNVEEENYMNKGARGTSVGKPDKKIKMYIDTKYSRKAGRCKIERGAHREKGSVCAVPCAVRHCYPCTVGGGWEGRGWVGRVGGGLGGL